MLALVNVASWLSVCGTVSEYTLDVASSYLNTNNPTIYITQFSNTLIRNEV